MNDPFDVLECIMNALDEELNCEETQATRATETTGITTTTETTKTTERRPNISNSLFNTIERVSKCERCNSWAATLTPFITLLLPCYADIPEIHKPTLQDCLADYFTIREDPAGTCQACEDQGMGLAPSSIITHILTSPKYLFLTFDRKDFKDRQDNGVYYGGSLPMRDIPKAKKVIPSHQLNLKPYIKKQNLDNIVTGYTLYGVLNLWGYIQGGHVTAYCKGAGGWTSYDDHTVKDIPAAQVLNSQALVLFYARNDILQ